MQKLVQGPEALHCCIRILRTFYSALLNFRGKLQGAHGQDILFVPDRIILLKFLGQALNVLGGLAQAFLLPGVYRQWIYPVGNRKLYFELLVHSCCNGQSESRALQTSSSRIKVFILSLASVLLVLLPSIEFAIFRELYFSSHSARVSTLWSCCSLASSSSSLNLALSCCNSSILCNSLLTLFSKESTIPTRSPIIANINAYHTKLTNLK